MLLGSIVLTGGQSRRMGKPKESLPWGDGSLLLSTVTTLLDCTFPVVVVARDRNQALPPLHTECELVCDSIPGAGPLVGIEAGMQHVLGKCDAVFVVGCDTPLLTTEAVGWLADQLGDHDGVVAEVGGERQPMSAIYSMRLLPRIKELLAGGERRAQALAALPGIRVLSEAEIDAFDRERRFLVNVNTPEDWQRVLARHGR
jgi:molybdopterin-guanine dinucleotide biosynthesis protein A